ncbi:MAG: hypothetical protein ACFHX7_10935 [Pseudomonadota bacterium]
MTGAISQMQVLYNAEEDRLLFRVNTTAGQQFRFWLTRRYCLLMLKVLKDHIDADPDVSSQESPLAREAVRSFKQEQAVQSANFSDEFVEDVVELPLGDQIPVAFRLTYNIRAGILNLGVQPKSGQGINIAINQQINSSLTQLLYSAGRKGDWGITPAALGPSEGQVVIN